MAKSWFYLTLWRGTPEEFTNKFDVQIHEKDRDTATVVKETLANTLVNRTSNADAIIHETSKYNSVVEKTTEVVWYVGVH